MQKIMGSLLTQNVQLGSEKLTRLPALVKFKDGDTGLVINSKVTLLLARGDNEKTSKRPVAWQWFAHRNGILNSRVMPYREIISPIRIRLNVCEAEQVYALEDDNHGSAKLLTTWLGRQDRQIPERHGKIRTRVIEAYGVRGNKYELPETDLFVWFPGFKPLSLGFHPLVGMYDFGFSSNSERYNTQKLRIFKVGDERATPLSSVTMEFRPYESKV